MDGPSYPRATWRLLTEPRPRDGAWNLAEDEAILRAVAGGHAPPTLRLYTFLPAVTLGRGQSIDEADRGMMALYGYRLLRRSSGGTAVFHSGEIAYSVVLPDDDPRIAGGVVASYRTLSQPLVYALEQVGLGAVQATSHPENRRVKSPVCFEISSDYEITVDGRKLVGSAQMRIKGGILQHGAIPLSGDIGHIGELLVSRPDPERIRARATTLNEVLERPVDWEEIAEALVAGFGRLLNVELQAGTLLPEERAEMEQLVAAKYTDERWTARI